MLISPFSPLFFRPIKSYGIGCPYIQTFATSDRILIEIMGETDWHGQATVYAEPSHEPLFVIQFNTWEINRTTMLRFTVLALTPGTYSVGISGIGVSETFKVTNSELELATTTLIQYSMKDNKSRMDGVFFIDGMQRFFDFRVPGGFKDSNWTFSVDNEQFVTADSDIIELYAKESTQQKFTLGNSMGCPIWFGEMLNRILCCSFVYFDGIRYCRKDSSVPEVTLLQDGINSFVFNQSLQKVVNIDPAINLSHQIAMRRTSDTYRLAIPDINRIAE